MPGVLIVEDDIFVALDLEHILMSADIRVNGIASDRKAAMAQAGNCDVALVDINLHDGTTGAVIGAELANHQGIKVIFVTSHLALVGEAASIAASIITKPFRPDTIVDAVRAASADSDIAFMPSYIAATEIAAEA